MKLVIDNKVFALFPVPEKTFLVVDLTPLSLGKILKEIKLKNSNYKIFKYKSIEISGRYFGWKE